MVFYAPEILEPVWARKEIRLAKARIMHDDSIFGLLYSQLVIQNRILFINQNQHLLV